nr:hypothetical protein [Angustibacter aerolatus]
MFTHVHEPAVRGQARRPGPRLRPPLPGGPGWQVGRDDRRHAVPVPGVELPAPRQVQGHAARHRHRGASPTSR